MYKNMTIYNIIMHAYVLSLSCCYLCKFKDIDIREKYIEKICYDKKILTKELFKEIFYQESKDLLERINPGEGIARNTALRENTFVMFTCIINKIPLFISGNPGCSKTLSINLI